MYLGILVVSAGIWVAATIAGGAMLAMIVSVMFPRKSEWLASILYNKAVEVGFYVGERVLTFVLIKVYRGVCLCIYSWFTCLLVLPFFWWSSADRGGGSFFALWKEVSRVYYELAGDDSLLECLDSPMYPQFQFTNLDPNSRVDTLWSAHVKGLQTIFREKFGDFFFQQFMVYTFCWTFRTDACRTPVYIASMLKMFLSSYASVPLDETILRVVDRQKRSAEDPMCCVRVLIDDMFVELLTPEEKTNMLRANNNHPLPSMRWLQRSTGRVLDDKADLFSCLKQGPVADLVRCQGVNQLHCSGGLLLFLYRSDMDSFQDVELQLLTGCQDETSAERWEEVTVFAAMLRLDNAIPCLELLYRLRN